MNNNSKIKNSICLIIPYFGKFPNYFDYFLISCVNNPTINWLIITDNGLESPSENIKVINMTFDDFIGIIKSKFDFEICLDSPYKLCDFKPAYGYILEDYISEFEFWGHCDTDMIFGDIRKFITDKTLSRHDKILRHGHLSMYRNTPEVNRWFMTLNQSNADFTYDKIFKSKLSLAFDEFGGKYKYGGIIKMIENAGINMYSSVDFDDIRYSQYSFYSLRPIENTTYSLKDISKMPSYYNYHNKRLYRHILTPKGENVSESLYVHFQKRKMSINSACNTDEFIMVPNEFISSETPEDIVWYKSRYKHFYLPYYMIRYKNLKRKIKYFCSTCFRRPD